MEREGVTTLSIHGFPWALRGFLIFKIPLCFVFENVLKTPWYSELCNVSENSGENIQSVLKCLLKSSFCVSVKKCFLSKLLTAIYFCTRKGCSFPIFL